MNRYYEAHLTVTPKSGQRWVGPVDMSYMDFADRSAEVGWKASMFEHDDVDDVAGKWFLSARNTDADAIINEVKGMVHGLTCSDYTVERWKIEWTLYDSKLGHDLEKVQ